MKYEITLVPSMKYGITKVEVGLILFIVSSSLSFHKNFF